MMRSSTKQAGVEFDGMELLFIARMALREGAHVVTVSVVDQFGHSWDGPSLYQKLQYFGLGKHQQPQPISPKVVVNYQSP